jgi:hypothetical protein
MHRGDTGYSCEQFQGKPPVATRLDICTTIEVTTLEEARMTSMRVDMQSVRGQSEYNNGADL